MPTHRCARSVRSLPPAGPGEGLGQRVAGRGAGGFLPCAALALRGRTAIVVAARVLLATWRLAAFRAPRRAFVEEANWTGPWRIDLVGITARPGADEADWELEHVRDITGGEHPS